MRERQGEVQLYWGQVPSPGRPTVAWREDRVRFWEAIAGGAKTEAAAAEAGVSSPVAFRWFRHAGGVNPCLVPVGVGPLSVVWRARGDRAVSGSGPRCARDRPAPGPVAVDGLAGVASERVDENVAPGVQGDDRSVACRAPRPPSEACEARCQRPAPRLCPGPALGAGPGARRPGAGPRGSRMERQEQGAPRRPPLGPGVEPRADLEPAAGRFPR